MALRPKGASGRHLEWGNILGSTSIVYILSENGVAISLLTNLQDMGTDLLRLAYDIAEIVEQRH